MKNLCQKTKIDVKKVEISKEKMLKDVSEIIKINIEELKNKINDLILIVWWDWDELVNYKKKYKNDSNVKILWSLVKKQILEIQNKLR